MATDLGGLFRLFRRRKEQWLLMGLLLGNGFLVVMFLKGDRELGMEVRPGERVGEGRNEKWWDFEGVISDRPVAYYYAPGQRNPFYTTQKTPTPRPVAERSKEDAEKLKKKVEEEKPKVKPTPVPPPRRITATLTGVMKGANGASAALIWDPDLEKVVPLHVGDTVQEAIVVSIQEKTVLLDDPIGQEEVTLEIAPKKDPAEGEELPFEIEF